VIQIFEIFLVRPMDYFKNIYADFFEEKRITKKNVILA